MEQYINSLIDGLKKKSEMLDELIRLTQLQKETVTKEKTDWDAFDLIVDQKAEIIEKLSENDDGFSAVFDRIKEKLMQDKDKYNKEIGLLQSGIKEVTEKSTSLMAMEHRVKASIEGVLSSDRKSLTLNKNSSKAANNYYKNMNRINFVDPQLMDSKK